MRSSLRKKEAAKKGKKEAAKKARERRHKAEKGNETAEETAEKAEKANKTGEDSEMAQKAAAGNLTEAARKMAEEHVSAGGGLIKRDVQKNKI